MRAIAVTGAALLSATYPSAAAELPAAYTLEQADLGARSFNQYCGACHDERLVSRFQTYPDVQKFYAFISDAMPRNEPGQLSSARYLALIAWFMQKSGFPAGDTMLTNDPSILSSIVPGDAAAD